MTLIRLPGLEALFGQPLDASAAPAIERLVEEGTAESQQLDWKRDLYPATDDGKGELAKDVCAMANATGGALIVGVAEVKGRASRTMPLEIQDSDIRRLRSTIASWTAPIPNVDLAYAMGEGGGYLIILVPPSTMAPHGVNAPGDEALRFPVRRGTQTDWLTEPELAHSYRARFTAMEDRTKRLREIERAASSGYLGGSATLTASLVPLLPGRSEITFSALAEAKEWVRANTQQGFSGQHRFRGLSERPGPGRIELVASFQGPAQYGSALLYTDGSGSATRELKPIHPDRPPPGVHDAYDFVLEEADLFSMVVDGLDLMVRHSTDRCGASGQVLASLTLLSPRTDPTLRLVHKRQDGIFSVEMGVGALTLPYGTSIGLDLTAMRTSAQALLLGARLLTEDLMHSIGTAEPYLIDRGGELRGRYASRENHVWADSRGVPITDEVVGNA